MRICVVLQWVADCDVRISFFLDVSGINTYENRKSEWKCVYFHWFRACHVRILLVFKGSVVHNRLYCAAADLRYVYFHWFWEGWIPADLQKQCVWDRFNAKVIILV